MPLILPRRSLLSYPAGTAPGFDPSHPAAKGISARHGYSGVAQGGGALRNLLKGTRDGPNGTPFPLPLDANIGAAVKGDATSYFSFPGNVAVLDLKITIAGIIRYKSSGADQPIFATTNTANSGIELYVGSANNLQSYSSSAVIASTITLNNNEAYFVAYSDNNTTSNFVAVSLQTGKRFTYVGASAALANASDGSYMVGVDAFANVTTFPVAAVSFTPSYLSISALLAWAQDPWSFWYPPAPPAQRKVSYSYSYGPAPALVTTRQYIAAPGVYVSETGTRSYMLAPGVYVTETISAVTAPATQYAAFSLPQHSLSQVIQKMVGY